MTYAVNIEKAKIEKHALVVVRLRRFITDWTDQGSNIWTAPFDYGFINRLGLTSASDGYDLAANANVASGEYYYDYRNSLIYLYSAADPAAQNTNLGVLSEYELNLADSQFTGPRDPLDGSSEIVDWVPGLIDIPQCRNGNQDTIFGFNPTQQSDLRIINADGRFNRDIYDSSFLQCYVKSYICANSDLVEGITNGDVKAVFLGFTNGEISLDQDGILSIACSDFFTFFDKPVVLPSKIDSDYGTPEPGSSDYPEEWYARRVHGMLDGHRPINIDYDATPAVDNNRIWVAMDGDTIDHPTMTLTVDHLAANGAAITYFTTTPKLNEGDWVELVHAIGGVIPVKVVNVDRDNKFITHAGVARTVGAGDTCLRYFIADVTVKASNGVNYNLELGVDYFPQNVGPDGLPGFVLEDDWEANVSFVDTIFDPEAHVITCRVYGPQTLPQFPDSDPVGAVVDEGGIVAQAVSILYHWIEESGIDTDLIDKDSFETVGADSHALALCIPDAHDTVDLPTYKEVINRILNSMLWKLSLVTSGNDIKIGLVAVQPFVASADYEADETQAGALTFKADFKDIYNIFYVNYKRREIPFTTAGSSFIIAASWVFQQSYIASYLHFVDREYSIDSLHYVTTEAQAICDRLAYTLGDRRGFYETTLGQEYLDRLSLGDSYDLIRKQLPGFSFDPETDNTRQLSVIEVQKSANGARIVFEDQKGIQDNSGDW